MSSQYTMQKGKCQVCGITACFGFLGETTSRFCFKHKELTMIDITHPRCQEQGCPIRASFNWQNDKHPAFCCSHAVPGMVDVVHKQCEKCTQRAYYNHPPLKTPITCFIHKEQGMKRVDNVECSFPNCTKYPSFNHRGEKKGVLCYDHAEAGMINVRIRHCEEDGCERHPTHNFANVSGAILCSLHATEGMVNVRGQICQHKECPLTASCNLPNTKPPIFCSTHATSGMVDVSHKRCVADGCTKQPTFNFRGLTGGQYCAQHKTDDMVDTTHKHCHAIGCTTRANFNHPGQKTGLFCCDHAEQGMIDIANKQCARDGCTKRPNFNFPGQKVGLYCSDDAEDGMIDVMSKRCLEPNCTKHPCFNFPGIKGALYCQAHAPIGMVDVMTKKCQVCGKTATYGFCGDPVTHCSKDKLKGMFYRPKRKCPVPNCREIPTHGKDKPEHCETHANADEMCFLQSPCKQCGDTDILTREGICTTKCAAVKRFTADKKNQKEKEMLMLAHLDNNIDTSECKILDIVDDKTIDTICNGYRPDRRYDCGSHMLIVECDEHQHKKMSICTQFKDRRHQEDCRMFAIQQASGVPCIFIRWNPDVCKINDVTTKKYPMTKRLETLVKWVKKCISMVVSPSSPPQYIELFYDEYDPTNTEFHAITEQMVVQ